MIASHFQREAERTEHTEEQYLTILNNLTVKDLRLNHHAIGAATEAGELADIAKKRIYYGTPIDITHVIEELGDLMWYVSGMCNALDLNLEVIMAANNSKLKARYPDKFDPHYANNRDLEKEREILENGKDSE